MRVFHGRGSNTLCRVITILQRYSGLYCQINLTPIWWDNEQSPIRRAKEIPALTSVQVTDDLCFSFAPFKLNLISPTFTASLMGKRRWRKSILREKKTAPHEFLRFIASQKRHTKMCQTRTTRLLSIIHLCLVVNHEELFVQIMYIHIEYTLQTLIAAANIKWPTQKWIRVFPLRGMENSVLNACVFYCCKFGFTNNE